MGGTQPWVGLSACLSTFGARERAIRIVKFGMLVVWRKGHRKVKFWWDWGRQKVKSVQSTKEKGCEGLASM